MSPQSGFDLFLVAMVTLVKIPLGFPLFFTVYAYSFPPKLKTEVAKMVGCMLFATLYSES